MAAGQLASQNLVWKGPAAKRPNDGANIRRITRLHGAAHSYALQDDSDNTAIGRRVNANFTSVRKYRTSPRFVPLSSVETQPGPDACIIARVSTLSFRASGGIKAARKRLWTPAQFMLRLFLIKARIRILATHGKKVVTHKIGSTGGPRPRSGVRAVRAWCVCAAALLAVQAMAAPTDVSHPFSISEKSFRCIREMTHIGHFYVDNWAGNLKGTIRVAKSTTGGVYPVGSVLQLVPTEVMVKREKGFNAATHDWEFFELDVSPNGSTIRTRGFADVNNRFGGNCFGCHVAARPEWDFVCDTTHGCAPIPITIAMSGALQRTDPRCKNRAPVSAEDTAALAQLAEVVKAMAAANAVKK